jgi:hypothetical protein
MLELLSANMEARLNLTTPITIETTLLNSADLRTVLFLEFIKPKFLLKQALLAS